MASHRDQKEITGDFEEEAMCETFELFTEFDGSSRDHFADQKKESFQIDLCGQDIRIGQDGRLQLGLGMTGARVWDAAVVLAKMIEFGADHIFHANFNTPTLELGAGCGLSGMATALLGIPTLLTDQDEMLPHLKRNLGNNEVRQLNEKRIISKIGRDNKTVQDHHLRSNDGFVNAVALQWGDPIQLGDFPLWSRNNNHSSAELRSPSSPAETSSPLQPSVISPPYHLAHDPRLSFSLVLCADLAYNEEVVPVLLETLIKVTSPTTLVLFSMELRTPIVLEDLLFKLLSKRFVIVRMSRSLFHPDYDIKSVVVYAMRRNPAVEIAKIKDDLDPSFFHLVPSS